MQTTPCTLPVPAAQQASRPRFVGDWAEDKGNLQVVKERKFSAKVTDALPNDLWVFFKTDSPNSPVQWVKKSHLRFLAERDGVALTEQAGGSVVYRTDILCTVTPDDIRLYIKPEDAPKPEAKEDTQKIAAF